MRFLWLLLACFSCSSITPYRDIGPYYGGPLLGPGTYFQDVEIELPNGKKLDFHGVFKRRPDGVQIAGLSPLGTTVFRISDSFKGEAPPKVEIFLPEMERFREKILEFYAGLRPLLLLEDKPERPGGVVRERFPDHRPKTLIGQDGTELDINEYDWSGHVQKFTILGRQWTAQISMHEFEPETE